MIETKLTVPEPGYVMRRRVKTVERERAAGVLTPYVQRRITYAELDGFSVKIARDAAVCPVCGREMPVYARDSCAVRTETEIEAWASLQTSLFGDPPPRLEFGVPVKEPGPLTCPECGNTSVRSAGEREATLTERRGKVSLTVALKTGDETRLLGVKPPESGWKTETLTFDLKSGKVYITLNNEHDSATRDVTGAEYPWPGEHPAVKLADGSKTVRRALKRAFERAGGKSLPFSARELSASRLVLLTRFQGYGREFYGLVPYSDGARRVGRTFRKAAERLRRADRVPGLYETTGLPASKSVKKILFSEPSLLFYADELKALWDVVGDVNLFRTLLGTHIYRNLAYLHMRPSAAEYLADTKAALGAASLVSFLTSDEEGWMEYAPAYLSFSKAFKAAERRKWRTQVKYRPVRNAEYRDFIGNSFSVPLLTIAEAEGKFPADAAADGFSFRRLRTSGEYLEAGRALDNCLTDWEEFRGNVYAVYDPDGKCAAAVELRGGKVHQALASENDPPEKVSGFPEALEAWMKQNGLEWEVPDEAYECM